MLSSTYRPSAVTAGKGLSEEDVLLEACDGEFDGEIYIAKGCGGEIGFVGEVCSSLSMRRRLASLGCMFSKIVRLSLVSCWDVCVVGGVSCGDGLFVKDCGESDFSDDVVDAAC